MSKTYRRALMARTIASIERFNPDLPPRVPQDFNREELALFIRNNLYYLSKATGEELADVAALIEICKRRN